MVLESCFKTFLPVEMPTAVFLDKRSPSLPEGGNSDIQI